MENIHVLDSDIIKSLIGMFNSGDDDNIKMGLTILNNADFTIDEAYKWINEINYECTGLYFALYQNNKGFIRARFAYIRGPEENRKHFIIDDGSSFDDNEGWIPYEPSYDDLNK